MNLLPSTIQPANVIHQFGLNAAGSELAKKRLGTGLRLLPLFAAVSCLGGAIATMPSLPISVPPASQPVATKMVTLHDSGSAITNGQNLQIAYNNASCGDEIVIDAGVTWTNNFVFNKKCTAASWIQVVSSKLSSAPIPTYATQAQANNMASAPAPPLTANLATLTSGNGGPPIVCTNSSNVAGAYNYFAGLEVTNPTGVYNLVMCTNSLSETSVSQLADHYVFDRFYVHGIKGSSSQQFIRGFLIAGSNISIVNSYVEDIYSTYQDSQAIAFAFGPGPYLVRNNFLEAAGENIMSGGVSPLPGFSCTISASPPPTNVSATFSTCVDSTNNSVAQPSAGICGMFHTSTVPPVYIPDGWTCLTDNNGGAVTFTALFGGIVPVAGTGTFEWGPSSSDFTITNNVIYKNPNWNPSSPSYDGVSGNHCDVAPSPAPTATSMTVINCSKAPWQCSSQSTCAESWIVSLNPTSFVTVTSVNPTTGAVTFLSTTPPPVGTGNVLIGPWRDVKDLFEIKSGLRWYVSGNIMQHSWNGGQSYAWNINSNDQYGGFPWGLTQDVTLTNNIVQDIAGAFQIIPAQSYPGLAPGPLARVLIENNLFWPSTLGRVVELASYIVNGGSPPAGSRNGADSVQIIHNNLLGPGISIAVGGTLPSIPENYTNMVVKDNIWEFDQYRWVNVCAVGPDGTACFNSSINTGGTATVANNAIINTGAVNGGQGVSDTTVTHRYGAMVLPVISDSYSQAGFVNFTGSVTSVDSDYHNFGLSTSSLFHGMASDGTDPGVNMTQLDAALSATPKMSLSIGEVSSNVGRGATQSKHGASMCKTSVREWPVLDTRIVTNPGTSTETGRLRRR